MAYSPDAMMAAYNEIESKIPSAQLGGIYANKPGYHNARSQLPSSDYSVQKPYDQEGDGDAAAALDVTLGDTDMIKVTQRLIDEAQAHGDTGKLRGAREFFGTLNGWSVTGMDVPGQYWVTSDDSHLWHVHVSGKRKYTNDKAAWLDIASVITGTASTAGAGDEDDDMPTQIEIHSKSGQTTKIANAGTWYAVGWDADLPNTGGASLSLPKGASLFTMTAWLTIESLGPDETLYWRLQTLEGSEHMAYFPTAEQRGSSGGTTMALAMVGSVPKGVATNLRLNVTSTQNNVLIKSASWRCLYW